MTAQLAYDFNVLAQYVAEGLFEELRQEGEGWDDMDPEEKQGIIDTAGDAARLTIAYLRENGVLLLPQGTIKAPESREEAQAMAAAGMAWLKAHPAPVTRPGIILPGRSI